MNRLRWAVVSTGLMLIGLAYPSLGQTDELSKVNQIRPFESTRTDVRSILGEGTDDGDSTWYQFEHMSIEVVFSDGTCIDGWLAPQGVVLRVEVTFSEDRKLSSLRRAIRLNRLRKKQALDVPGELYYYDDANGVGYEVNERHKTWSSVWYFPSSRHTKGRCSD